MLTAVDDACIVFGLSATIVVCWPVTTALGGDGLGAIRRATHEQSGGHAAIAEAARSMKDVTQQLWRTTEEQTRSLSQIGESVEGVRDHAAVIHNAVESQSGSCAKSVQLLEELASHAESNEARVHEMEDALLAMLEESQKLREDVHRFDL